MSPTEFRNCVKKIQSIDVDMDAVLAMFFIFEYSKKLSNSSPQRIWDSLSFVDADQGPLSTAKFYKIQAQLLTHVLNMQQWTRVKLIELINDDKKTS